MILDSIKKEKKKKRLCLIHEMLARMALKYGYPGSLNKYNANCIEEFWNDNSNPPSLDYLNQIITLEHIKWFIHNMIIIEDEIWNADFLYGFIQNTQINWNSKKFPIVNWQENNNITKIIQVIPFGGQYSKKQDMETWANVPALYLKHSAQSSSYIAGLLSCGKIYEYDNYKFAMYEYNNAKEQIAKLGIPIEKNIDNKILISPFWPALLSFKTPKIINNWYNIKNAYNANLYASILWKTYVDTKFIRSGIPYLKSSRSIYYTYKCEEGAIRYLEKQRLVTNLVSINVIFRDIVQYLANEIKEKDEILIN